jgi:hypothetical protein
MSELALVTNASWEPRFLDSVAATLNGDRPNRVYVLYSAKYQEWTFDARRAARALAQSAGSRFSQIKLDFESPAALWGGVAHTVQRLHRDGVQRFVVDGTTMPREVTWYLLHACAELRIDVRYVYVPVGEYGAWLSKESLRPRLVLKRSGVLLPDRPTAVVAISGYDIGRLNQMLLYFEPRKICIARQVGDRYQNNLRNTPNLSEFTRHAEFFDFDGYDLGGNSYQVLKNAVLPLLNEYNVLLASLGPKLSSITAFQVTAAHPDVALVYIPSETYNREYSKGSDLSRRVVADLSCASAPPAGLLSPLQIASS